MDWTQAKIRIKCPYYVDHSYPRKGSRPSIECLKPSSIKVDCDLQLKFKKMDVRDDYIRSYCESSYCTCPIFGIITREELEHEKK